MGGFFGLTPGGTQKSYQGDGGAFFGVSNVTQAGPSGGWTARTIGTAATAFNSNVAATNGIALLVDGNSEVWKSTDGGHTWQNTGVNLPGVFAIAAAGSTFLLFSATNAWRTTDAVTFTGPHTLNFTGLNGFATAARDNATTWVVGSTGSRNTSISTDDGLTWTQHTILGTSNWVVSFIYDGTQWVGLLSSGTQIGTSPDGITWSFTTLTPGGDFFNNTLGFLAGPHYLCSVFNGANNAVRNAATPAGLATAADVNTGIPGSSGLQCVLVGNGIYWVFDNTGLTAGSNDFGLTWSQVPLNFKTGDFPGTVFQAYDAVNHSFIAIGTAGISISTHNDSDIL